MHERRPVALTEDVGPDFDDVVGTDTQEEPVEGRTSSWRSRQNAHSGGKGQTLPERSSD